LRLAFSGRWAARSGAVADLRGRPRPDVAGLGARAAAGERRWHEPDHGLWEARLPPRHHVYSKVMCWLTVDRAIQIGERHGTPIHDGWRELRATIAENVLTRGWHDDVGAYTV